MIRLGLILYFAVFSLNFAYANGEESLPIAPKRSDDRDLLPTAPFVSLTGQDPFLPETENQGKRPAANPPKNAKFDRTGANKLRGKTAQKMNQKTIQKSVSKNVPSKAKKTASQKASGVRKPAQTLPKKKLK